VEELTDSRAGGPPESDGAWDRIAGSPEFERLEALRRRLTIALLGVFVAVFGVFLVLCAYARPFMRRSVDGGLTVAYVWLLGLTLLAWVLVWVYLRVADGELGSSTTKLVEDAGRRSTPPTGSAGSERAR